MRSPEPDGLRPVKWGSRIVFDLRLLDRNGDVFVLDIEPETIEEAHIDVRDPDKRKPRDQVAAPTRIEHLKLRDQKKKCCHIVAEAVFAGKEVEEFAGDKSMAVLALVLAPFARLPEDLFMGYGPGDTSDGQGKNKKVRELNRKWHRHHDRHPMC